MQQRKRERRHHLAATSIAMLGYCEAKLVLQRRYGDMSTPQQDLARERGVEEHEVFHHVVSAHHNTAPPPASGTDKRCFIASAVYGADDPRTWRLRAWRDERLAPTRLGRIAIALYYRKAPALVRLCARRPALARIARVLLDAFIRALDGR